MWPKTPFEVMGINTRADLAKAAQYLRQRSTNATCWPGVTLIDPAATYIDREVEIGRDTVIYPNCFLLGKTFLGVRLRDRAGLQNCRRPDRECGDRQGLIR